MMTQNRSRSRKFFPTATFSRKVSSASTESTSTVLDDDENHSPTTKSGTSTPCSLSLPSSILRELPSSSSSTPPSSEFLELQKLVEWGDIFAARKIVDDIRSNKKHLGKDPKLIALMDDIILQSDSVTKMLSDLDEDEGWTLAKESKGVTVHVRPDDVNKGSCEPIVRASTILEGFTIEEFTQISSLFVETDLMPLWFAGGFMESNTEIASPTQFSKVCHMKLKGNAFFAPRDSVLEGWGYQIPERKAFVISSKSVHQSNYCEVPAPAKGTVRIDVHSVFYLELMPESNSIRFRFITHNDLKLKYVPTCLLNFLCQGHMPWEVMNNIRKALLNFKGSPFEGRMKQKVGYYKVISDLISTISERTPPPRTTTHPTASSPSSFIITKQEPEGAITSRKAVTVTTPKTSQNISSPTEDNCKNTKPGRPILKSLFLSFLTCDIWYLIDSKVNNQAWYPGISTEQKQYLSLSIVFFAYLVTEIMFRLLEYIGQGRKELPISFDKVNNSNKTAKNIDAISTIPVKTLEKNEKQQQQQLKSILLSKSKVETTTMPKVINHQKQKEVLVSSYNSSKKNNNQSLTSILHSTKGMDTTKKDLSLAKKSKSTQKQKKRRLSDRFIKKSVAS